MYFSIPLARARSVLRFAKNTVPSAKGGIANLNERIRYPETSYDFCKYLGICSGVLEVNVILERSAESMGGRRLRFLKRRPVRSLELSLINYRVMWRHIPEDTRPLLAVLCVSAFIMCNVK